MPTHSETIELQRKPPTGSQNNTTISARRRYKTDKIFCRGSREPGVGAERTTNESNSNDSQKRRAQGWYPRAPKSTKRFAFQRNSNAKTVPSTSIQRCRIL